MTDARTTPTAVTFDPPRAGCWELETTHHGLRPLSPLLREAYRRSFEDGTKELVERYGLPLDGVDAELVHGCFYVRPRGLGEGEKPSPTPPRLVMKVLARLHPGLRRRNRAAAEAWRTRRWRAEVDEWFVDRAEVVEQNLRLQAVDLTALDDGALVDAMTTVLAHFESLARRNLAGHGGDLMPVGDLLAHCDRWGIAASEAASLLHGSSPATLETAELLRPVAGALATSGATPGAVDDLRALGDDVRDAIDTWRRLHAWRLLTSDDVDRATLAELPSLELATLLAAVDVRSQDPPVDPGTLRDRLPPTERALFDELLEEARYGMRQREDIRGICWNWPGGLVRRAMLEVGRRLADRRQVDRPEHAAELFPEELAAVIQQGSGPDRRELAERAAQRDRIELMPPPRQLGEAEAPPPIDALPAPMARATAAMMANLASDATSLDRGELRGVGIGDEVYRGRACLVRGADDALERLRPGDVMVARFTGPSFNSVLPLLGGLVVEEGGALCHAAIVAREFGVPAVIGAQGATTRITDGAVVEIDPLRGVVRPQ